MTTILAGVILPSDNSSSVHVPDVARFQKACRGVSIRIKQDLGQAIYAASHDGDDDPKSTHLGFLCKFCGDIIPNDEKLFGVHLKSQHNASRKTNAKKPAINPRYTMIDVALVCKICGYTSLTLNGLKIHNGIKHSEIIGPLSSCPFCDYSSKRKDHIKAHFRLAHKKSETYECDICGSVFYSSSNLNRHKKAKHLPYPNDLIDQPFYEPSASTYSGSFKSKVVTHLGSKRPLMHSSDNLQDDVNNTQMVEPAKKRPFISWDASTA